MVVRVRPGRPRTPPASDRTCRRRATGGGLGRLTMRAGACHPSAMDAAAGWSLHGSRDFHVRRTARERYGVDDTLLGIRGDLAVADLAAIRVLAQRMNGQDRPEAPGITAGEIGALGLLHEIGHLLVTRQDSPDMGTAMRDVRRSLRDDLDRLLDRYAAAFPGSRSRAEPRVVQLEELLLTRVSNENPALGSLRELVDDRILAQGTRYQEAIAGWRSSSRQGDLFDVGDGTQASLVALLRAPARHAPTSLAGQLRYIRDHWARLLGSELDALIGRLDIAIGILTEEEHALHQRFGGPSDGTQIHAPSFRGLGDEPERFSVDSAWMPRLVLMAKSTYVWLDQLSRQFGRDIRTLDAVPDEALDRLASWGVTGLWLIGLWQRSAASERIKRMRGNAEAVASAYSLDDYRIADDLGGEAAYANLRDRAWARGIRLASDMVPNHMGIDSRWVIDHPEWFLSLPQPPYPAYRFTGPDLSLRTSRRASSSRTTTGTTATPRSCSSASTARAARSASSTTATTARASPWNDTAQLDFLKAEVREQVIRTILDVARRFPVIRFDAAMVLAKRHVRRLWWPEPGAGRRHPVARRVRDEPGRVRRADAGRVLARGRRPGRGRGARHAPAGRGVLDARGLLRPDARHAPRLQQRVHAHAPRRERRRLPQAHPRDARVRPGDPQALRQLHEQPRREDGGRAVRQGRQVLRRRDGHGDAARLADARSRPGRGLRREVRHGVPPGDLDEPPIRGWSSATSARSSRCSTGGTGSPRRTTSSCSTSIPTAAPSTRTSSPTRTGTDRPARWSSSTTASPRRPGRSASRRPTRASRRAGPSAWSADRSPRAWASPTTRRCS